MNNNEIIEKKQSLIQNDINHFNSQMNDIENEILRLNKKKNLLHQKIGKKQIYFNQLENDKIN